VGGHLARAGGQRAGFPQLVRYFDREATEGRLQPSSSRPRAGWSARMHLFGSPGALCGRPARVLGGRVLCRTGIVPFALAAACDHAFLVLGCIGSRSTSGPRTARACGSSRSWAFVRRACVVTTCTSTVSGATHRTFALTSEDLTSTSWSRSGTTHRNRDIADSGLRHQRHTGARPHAGRPTPLTLGLCSQQPDLPHLIAIWAAYLLQHWVRRRNTSPQPVPSTGSPMHARPGARSALPDFDMSAPRRVLTPLAQHVPLVRRLS